MTNATATVTLRDEARHAVQDRDWGLDALRAAACLLVFVFHVDATYGLAGGWLRGGGVAGVYTFFVLSGYLLYRPFLRRSVPLKGYAIRRIARIYPAYLLALVGLSVITGNPTFWEHPLQYLLFVQNFDPTLFQGFVGVTWTLQMEVGFYIALPLLATVIAGRPRRLLALAAPSLFAWLVVQTWVGSTPTVTLFPLYGWMFAMGMVLAMAVERGWRPTSLRSLAAGVAMIGATLLISGPAGRADSALHYALMIGLTEAGAALVAAWLMARRIPSWLLPVAVFGGAVSYAFYLWHADVVGWMAVLKLAPIAAAVVAFTVTLAIATVSWLLVEKPAIHLAKYHRWRFGQKPRAAVVEIGMARTEEPGQA